MTVEDIVDAEVIGDTAPETRKDRARRLLLEAAILDRLTAANREARRAIADEYEASDADVASYEGVPLGRVRMDNGRVTVSVTDQAYALRWVQANAPHQVQEDVVVTVTPDGLAWLSEHHPEWLVEQVLSCEVHPAFLTALVARVKKAKGQWVTKDGLPDVWTDPDTGEESTGLPPFIGYRQGDPILNVTLSDEAPGVALRLLAGRLPELEGLS
jgi:hypothetical protein